MKKATQQYKGTLLQALETIYTKAEDSHLDEAFFEAVKQETDYVSQKWGVTAFQAVALAYFLDQEEPVCSRELCQYTKTNRLKLLQWGSELEELANKRFVWRTSAFFRGSHCSAFSIRQKLFDSMLNNSEYTPQPYAALSAKEVLTEMDGLLEYLKESADTWRYGDAVGALRHLLQDTHHLIFSQEILPLNLPHQELTILMATACRQILHREDSISPRDYEDLFPPLEMNIRVCQQLDAGTSLLSPSNLDLLTVASDDGFAEPGRYELTEHAKAIVFPEFKLIKQAKAYKSQHLQEPKDIVKKQLFFNPREGEQLSRLQSLLGKRELSRVQNRMKKEGMRTGFACLLYGAPGTGKSESAKQIAKQCGRAIFEVDLAQIRDKYVGESEKRLQGLFDTYAKLVEQSKDCPILVLNEADALISKRTTNPDSSVDKMENAMQNILLLALENFKGVLIATTNLPEGFDSAFERRFIMKIRFDKPGTDVRAKIWQTMLSDLPDCETMILAEKYPFSGGQIENVARKHLMNKVLYDTPCTLDNIVKLCDEESIQSASSRRPIGFM